MKDPLAELDRQAQESLSIRGLIDYRTLKEGLLSAGNKPEAAADVLREFISDVTYSLGDDT